jgi:hypothetical protein
MQPQRPPHLIVDGIPVVGSLPVRPPTVEFKTGEEVWSLTDHLYIFAHMEKCKEWYERMVMRTSKLEARRQSYYYEFKTHSFSTGTQHWYSHGVMDLACHGRPIELVEGKEMVRVGTASGRPPDGWLIHPAFDPGRYGTPYVGQTAIYAESIRWHEWHNGCVPFNYALFRLTDERVFLEADHLESIVNP